MKTIKEALIKSGVQIAQSDCIETTQAFCRMVRRMTQTDGFYVSVTGHFAIAASIYELYESPNYLYRKR